MKDEKKLLSDQQLLVRAHIIQLGRWVRDRDIDAIAYQCAIPFIVYTQGEIVALDCLSKMKAVFAGHCDAVNSGGTFTAQVRFVSHEVKPGGRHAVVVEWHLDYHEASENVVLSTLYMFRVKGAPNAVTLEMIENLAGQETDISRRIDRHFAELVGI